MNVVGSQVCLGSHSLEAVPETGNLMHVISGPFRLG